MTGISTMTRARLGLGAASAAPVVALLALAACTPPHPHRDTLHVISALDCPDSQGDLTRKTVGADGKTCEYATDSGDRVSLRLVSLDGKEPHDVLAPIEAEVKAEAPPATADAPPVPPGAPDKAADKGDGGHDRVDIDLPGIHIHSSGDGRSKVDAGGVHVDAHDGPGHSGDHADVQIGGGGSDSNGVTVNARDGGAQVRVNGGGSGVRAVYMLTGDAPGPHGYKVVGYEARGPKSGPIVVAVIMLKTDDADDLRHDVRDLLRHNVGG